MNLTPERGAIPIQLDCPRILFFDAAASFLLVQRFGMGFAAALYELDKNTPDGLRLRSVEALQYFLWAGLQADLKTRNEELTLEQVEGLIRPWTLPMIFRKTVLALVGATHAPEPVRGKDEAADSSSKPAAKKTARRKVSTLKTRSGLRLQR